VIIPKKDLATATSYLETLKSVENPGAKPDWTIGTCRNLVNSFLAFDKVWWSFQESVKEYSS
jgi:hypothetical protein